MNKVTVINDATHRIVERATDRAVRIVARAAVNTAVGLVVCDALNWARVVSLAMNGVVNGNRFDHHPDR